MSGLSQEMPVTVRRDARHLERGQGLAEYALILSLVALSVLLILTIFGGAVANVYGRVEASLSCAMTGRCQTANVQRTEQVSVEYARCVSGQLQWSIITNYAGNTVVYLGPAGSTSPSGMTQLTYDRGVNRHRGAYGSCPITGATPFGFYSDHIIDTYDSAGTITLRP